MAASVGFTVVNLLSSVRFTPSPIKFFGVFKVIAIFVDEKIRTTHVKISRYLVATMTSVDFVFII